MRIEDVRFTSLWRWGESARLTLAATLYQPPAPTAEASRQGEPFPGLVVGHGAGSHRRRHDAFCRVACSAGFAVLAFDFRGHGESEGVTDGPLELDVSAAAEMLRRRSDVDARAVCYRGSSMGGFYGLKSAPAVRFAAMALLCPADEQVMLDGIRKEEQGRGRSQDGRQGEAAADPTIARWDFGAMARYFEAQESAALAAAVDCPVLLVHARGDETVPYRRSLDLAGYLPGDVCVTILRGGSHTSAQHDPRVHTETTRWLREKVAASTPPRGC